MEGYHHEWSLRLNLPHDVKPHPARTLIVTKEKKLAMASAKTGFTGAEHPKVALLWPN